MITTKNLSEILKKYIKDEGDVLFIGQIQPFMTTAEPFEFKDKKGSWILTKLEEIMNYHGDVLIINMDLKRSDGKKIK